METFDIPAETVEKLSKITNIEITDNYSFDLAIHRLVQQYNNGCENVGYLQKKLTEHGIKTVLN